MKEIKVGFIGFGNMAQAMAEGMIRGGALEPDRIYACAGNQDKLSAFLDLVSGFEILELARTGITGLTRGSSDVTYLE